MKENKISKTLENLNLENFNLTKEKYDEAKEICNYVGKAFEIMDDIRARAQSTFLAAFLIEYGRQSERKAGSKNENSSVL